MVMETLLPTRRRSRRARALAGVAGSAAAHVVVLSALVWAPPPLPAPVEAPPMTVALVEPFTPPAPAPVDPEPAVAAPPAPEPPAPAKAPPPRAAIARRTPAPPETPALASSEDASSDSPWALGEADLASAAPAGSGVRGGACDMGRRLEAALRRDVHVQAAVAQARFAAGAAAKGFLVWNGDWVQTPGQEGKGLAAVRQAIVWEIAFAPEACRAQAVRGRILISLNDAPGSARLVVGSGDWRWADLAPRPTRRR
jgi:hypothetical protein